MSPYDSEHWKYLLQDGYYSDYSSIKHYLA